MLVRQDETFELGINNRAVYFKVEGVEELEEIILLKKDSYLISENVWNTVTVTFDEKVLTVYVNGIKCGETQASAAPKTSTACYEIAKDLDGYLRYVKLFNSCFSNEKVIANLFEDNAQTDETELFLDFSLPEPEDKGKYRKQITLNNINIKEEALRVENNGSAELRNSDKLNEIFAGEESFTVIFNIYPFGQDVHHNMMLLSNAQHDAGNKFNIVGFFQEESVSNRRFGISVEYASSSANVASVPINQWSQVAIVYDSEKKEMHAYVNAEKIFENTTWNPPESVCDGSIYVCSARGDDSRAFDGYMKYLTVFQEVLNNDQIKEYYNDINSSMANKNLKSMYVCKGNEFIDTVDNLQATLTGDAYVKTVSFNNSWCNPTSLVYSLDVGEKGCALVSDAEGLHKVLSTGSFSIYSKVFLGWQYGESALLSCVYDSGGVMNTGMEILLNRSAESISFNIKIDGMGYVTDSVPINPEASWIDIGFIYYENEKKIRIFVMDNGQEIQKIVIRNITNIDVNIEKAKIGNSVILDRPFKGYIDYIAIFDYALSEEKIEKYPMNPPYIFEEGIKYLYCFNWKYPAEQVSQTVIELSDGATVATRIGTQNVLVAPPELDIPEYTPSAREQWEANIILDAYSSLCMSMMGIKVKSGFIEDPTTNTIIASSAFVLFYKMCLAKEPAIKAVIENFSNITKLDFEALTKIFFDSEMAPQLAAIFGVGGMTGAAIPLSEATGVIAAGVAGVGAAAGFTMLVYEMVQAIIGDRDPEPNDDQGFIQSITFNTDRTGSAAVPIEGSADISNILFISETVNAVDAYIEVRYEYMGTNEYTVRLRGKNSGIIGDLEEQSHTFTPTTSRTHIFRFPLTRNTMKGAVCGKFIETVEWIENDELKTTKEYNVYLLAKMPSSPWNIAIPENSPTLNALKTFAQITAYSAQPKEYSVKYIADATVRWLQESGRFVASPERINKFSKRDGSVLYFNRADFDIRVNDTAAEKIEMSALDCSLVIADTARLNGFSELNVTELTTGFTVPVLKADPNQNPIPIIQTGDTKIPLDMKQLYKIGASEPQIEQDLTNHFIALTRGENITEQSAYDGYFKEEDGKLLAGRQFADMETSFVFSDDETLYRESVFTKYTCCDIEKEYSGWVHGVLEARELTSDEIEITEDINEEDDDGYVRAFKITIPDSARNFEQFIKNKFNNGGQNKAICHSISYSEIKKAIITNVENYFINDEYLGQYINSMTYLTYALFCIENDKGLKNLIRTFDNEETNDTYNMIYHNIQRIYTMVDTIHNHEIEDREKIINRINSSCIYLCKAMNNVIYNLRLGDSSWNQSVGDAFDPVEWCYVDENNNVTSCYENILTYEAIPYRDYDKFNGMEDIPGKGFYLTNLNDGIRCNRMSNVYEREGGGFSIKRDQIDVNNITKHYIISSSNAGDLIRNNIKIAADAKIYYYYGRTWQEL